MVGLRVRVEGSQEADSASIESNKRRDGCILEEGAGVKNGAIASHSDHEIHNLRQPAAINQSTACEAAAACVSVAGHSWNM